MKVLGAVGMESGREEAEGMRLGERTQAIDIR